MQQGQLPTYPITISLISPPSFCLLAVSTLDPVLHLNHSPRLPKKFFRLLRSSMEISTYLTPSPATSPILSRMNIHPNNLGYHFDDVKHGAGRKEEFYSQILTHLHRLRRSGLTTRLRWHWSLDPVSQPNLFEYTLSADQYQTLNVFSFPDSQSYD